MAQYKITVNGNLNPAPQPRLTPGDIVHIPRQGFYTAGTYRYIKFIRYGSSSNDRHGFYGSERRWSEDSQKFYWDSGFYGESFWELEDIKLITRNLPTHLRNY